MAEKKINILHIDTEKSWRGGQQQVLYLHRGLVEKGISSLLVCPNSSELKKRCEKEKLPFIGKNMFGEIDLIASFSIAQICKRKNINIIQAHSAHALSIGLLVKFFSPEIILIAVRRVDFPIGKNFISQIKYKSKKINKIVCISEFIKKVLIKDGLNEENLLTIRSGVDINRFNSFNYENDFRKSLYIKPNEFLIGTIAAFAGHKDYPNLLKAFSYVLKEKPNTKLCLVGDGPLKSEIVKLIDELQIEEKVILPGFRSDVGNFLKSFNLFVMASKKEGLGTSVIDALSVGLPVIATNAGGIPELIFDGENGILVEPQNPAALSKAIIDLISNEDKRDKIAKNALESVNRFSIENTILENISLYEELLNNNYEN